MKTLYLSDLDGTLLGSDQKVSRFTAEAINRLVEKGMIFSYATARSVVTARVTTEGIDVSLPIIAQNGVFIQNNHTGDRLHAFLFSRKDIGHILSAFAQRGLYPIVYALIDGRERFSYVRRLCSREQNEFLSARQHDVRERLLEDPAHLAEGDIYYFSCIDTQERLAPIYGLFKDKFRCYFARDIYSGDWWLEITPRQASKAQAAKILQKQLGCEKLVCFGDGVNDLPMFEIADECYAVANADERLKAVATGVIGANTADGVARFLLERFGE